MEGIKNIIKTSKNMKETTFEHGWTIPDVLAKSIEELGEFAQAVQIERGVITNKELIIDETFREAADVMVCIIDTLCKLYPHMTEQEIYDKLSIAMFQKTAKWQEKTLEKEAIRKKANESSD